MSPYGPRSSRRGGASLVEALVVVVLSALVVHATWGLLAGQLGAAATAAAAAERLDAARAGRFVLGEEIRSGRPGSDWTEPRADTIRLRAFRGVALACPSDDLGEAIRVRTRSIRSPDPAKDSVLVLVSGGQWLVRRLEDSSAEPLGRSACPPAGPGWTVERWKLPDLDGDVVAGRLFESGSYHVAEGAVRYRRGEGGRQPLTPELLDDAESELGPGAPGGAVRLRFAFRGSERRAVRRIWQTTVRSSAP